MASRTLHCEVIVLARGEPRESCTPYTLLCPEHGVLPAQQRRGKGAGGPALDLFDGASLTLAGDDAGGPWFVREARIDARRPGIAARYEALRLASRLTAMIARNPLAEEGRAAVHALTGRALDAMAAHPGLAEAVYLKFCYSFARDEGYAVRQHWLAELHGALRAEAEALLTRPLAELAAQAPDAVAETHRDGGIGAAAADSWAVQAARRLVPRLDHWLREHTDIRTD